MKKKKVLANHRVQKSSKKLKKLKKNKVKKIVVRRKYKKRAEKIPVVTITPVVDVPIVAPAAPPVVATEEPPKKGRRGRRGKGTGTDKMYFTKETENYIIQYNSTEDTQIREDLYNNKIKYPFDKLVENIFNTFKFTYFETGPLDVQKETVAHLVSNMHKFEAGKGKAFSYFSIIAKHYLIALNNTTYKRRNQHVEIGEEHDEHTVQLQTEDKHYKEAEMRDFMRLMIEFWENNVGKIFTKQRDLDIANAVIELFRSSERIDAFNKKALYLYIREISSCKTQQITKVINKMKQYQSNISKSYMNRGSINTENYIKA